VLQTGSFTLTGIVWLLWLHSSYSLLRHAGTKVTRFSPGWAVGCWFLPLVNLVRPYQVVRELLQRSRGLNASAETIARHSADVALWWLAWLAGTAGVLQYAATLESAKTSADFIFADNLGIVGCNLEAAAALLAYHVVRQILRAQNAAAALADSPVTPPAAGQ
jgi:hypothetical protein